LRLKPQAFVFLLVLINVAALSLRTQGFYYRRSLSAMGSIEYSVTLEVRNIFMAWLK